MALRQLRTYGHVPPDSPAGKRWAFAIRADPLCSCTMPLMMWGFSDIRGTLLPCFLGILLFEGLESLEQGPFLFYSYYFGLGSLSIVHTPCEDAERGSQIESQWP